MTPSQSRAGVNRGGTQDDGKTACGCTSTRCAPHHPADGCTALRSATSKTCRPCYLANLGTTARKFEPAEHGAMLARMLTAAGRRARREDPGQGLAMLVEVQRAVDALVAEVGADVLGQYQAESADGLTRMAEDLTLGTGQAWSRQRVHKRWAPKQNGQVPADVSGGVA